jgi:hypothetical protein
MNLLEKLRLDRWFGIVLYLGVLLVAASIFAKVSFIENKLLFGLGLGCVLIGVSYFMAEKYLNQYIGTGIVYTKIIKHNFATILILLVGIGMVLFFGFRVVKSLI